MNEERKPLFPNTYLLTEPEKVLTLKPKTISSMIGFTIPLVDCSDFVKLLRAQALTIGISARAMRGLFGGIEWEGVRNTNGVIEVCQDGEWRIPLSVMEKIPGTYAHSRAQLLAERAAEPLWRKKLRVKATIFRMRVTDAWAVLMGRASIEYGDDE